MVTATKNKETFAIPTKAVKILRKVEELILEEPRRLAMDRWGETFSPESQKQLRGKFTVSDYNLDFEAAQQVPPCGTAACIAGHALIVSPEGRKLIDLKRKKDGTLTAKFDKVYDFGYAAAHVLGSNYENLRPLFHVINWPVEFQEKYTKAKTAKQRAKVTVDRIEHFIHTGS